MKESFSLSNDVLKHGVQSVTDLMVRPGMINLDFADVETVMSAMGKAMMGTGEAEGENRAMAATEMALNNPLIDEYSLKGAKGLLVNITGGKDITLFEVDQSVNKIRAEVDPEAELIFGAIKDDNMEGKIRVSIVATSLDGHKPESKTVLNMVNRIHNRNTGYSENLFKNTNLNQSPIGSIDGATALKLDEQLELKSSEDQLNNSTIEQDLPHETSQRQDTESVGISIENASYIENNLDIENHSDKTTDQEEHTPKLFSGENHIPEDNNFSIGDDENHNEKLFDQNSKDEEEFEIPAFLRKQKF